MKPNDAYQALLAGQDLAEVTDNFLASIDLEEATPKPGTGARTVSSSAKAKSKKKQSPPDTRSLAWKAGIDKAKAHFQKAGDKVADYTKNNPKKALAIAGGTGVAIATLHHKLSRAALRRRVAKRERIAQAPQQHYQSYNYGGY